MGPVGMRRALVRNEAFKYLNDHLVHAMTIHRFYVGQYGAEADGFVIVYDTRPDHACLSLEAEPVNESETPPA